MPAVDLPVPLFVSALPSPKTLGDIPALRSQISDGLKRNTLELARLAGGEFAAKWGVPATIEAFTKIFDVSSVTKSVASAILDAIGLGASAVPIIGAVIKLITTIIKSMIAASGMPLAPGCISEGRPLEGRPCVFHRETDTDLTRTIISMVRKENLNEYYMPPGLTSEGFPKSGDRCEAAGGKVKVQSGGFLLPGGRLYLGEQIEPRLYTWCSRASAPSASQAARFLWASIMSTGGLTWSLDTEVLLAAWKKQSLLGMGLRAYNEGLALGTPPLSDPGAVHQNDIPTDVYAVLQGEPLYIPTTVNGVPVPIKNGFFRGFSRIGVVGEDPDGWVSRACVDAISGILALQKHQDAAALTEQALYGAESQPGVSRLASVINTTIQKAIHSSTPVDTGRVADKDLREALLSRSPNQLAARLPKMEPGEVDFGAAGQGGLAALGALAFLLWAG